MNDDRHNLEVEAAHRRIDALERIIKTKINNPAPTVPQYDQFNFPQDAAPGQIATDPNDNTMWVYGNDNVWHQVGGGRIGAAAHLWSVYLTGGGSDPFTSISANSSLVCPFYHYATTDQNAIAFHDSSGSETTTTPLSGFTCNSGFNNGGIYTFFLGVHVASGGYSEVDAYFWDGGGGSDLFPHGWTPGANISHFAGLGLTTQQDYDQIFCASSQSKNLSVVFYNNNTFTVALGWVYATCMFVPTLDPNTSNPNALNSQGPFASL